MRDEIIVTDASSLLNLIATGRALEILTCLHLRLLTTPQARAEVTRFAGPPDENGRPTYLPAETLDLDRTGRLTVRALPPEAASVMVACAERLRDADASVLATAAIASHRLVSDDRRLVKVATELYPDIELSGVLWLFRQAIPVCGWSPAEVRTIARTLHERGRFAPPRGARHSDWYAELLR